MKTLDVIATILILIGALNWGLVGFFNFNLVQALFGQLTVISRVIYAVVGIAALYYIVEWSAMQERWASGLTGGKPAPQI
jgi:uncharacterized membrane protein YuzA (DUF378 family)